MTLLADDYGRHDLVNLCVPYLQMVRSTVRAAAYKEAAASPPCPAAPVGCCRLSEMAENENTRDKCENFRTFLAAGCTSSAKFSTNLEIT